MQAQQQNMEPNRYSEDFELSELIRQNMDQQHQERIKNTLMKESLVKLSLDKDFEHMYRIDANNMNNESEVGISQNNNNSIVEVNKETKEVCEWLQQSQQFKGMAYLPFANIPKLLHILHQKIQNTVIIVTDYHSYWLERMEDMNRLSVMKWAFLNVHLSKEEKIKVLELYQMRKTKLLFISPSIFNHQEYLEFQCDLLVISDLHLFASSKKFFDKIIQKCSPGRVLGLHSNPLKGISKTLNLNTSEINSLYSQNSTYSPTMIALKCQSQNDDKFKSLLGYLQKNQNLKQTLILVNNKAQAANLSKKLKLKSLTSFNFHDFLNAQEINYFSSSQILYRPNKNGVNGYATEDKVLETMYKSKNYNVTIGKYFDALRFSNYDSVIFYDFVDVPKFVSSCPDVKHRVILLADDDYFTFRNEITKNIHTLENLARITLKIMEKPRKKEQNPRKRYYSQFIQSNALLSCYSATKQAIQKNEEKVLRLNNFCRVHDITLKALYQIIESLCSLNIIEKICKLTYQIEVSDQSLSRFREHYPQAIQIRSRVSLLGLATSLKLTTNQTLQEISSNGIAYKITEEALQLRILKEYNEINFQELEELVNQNIMLKVREFDESYTLYKDLSYGSVELTRREKYLNRWKSFVEFYNFKKMQSSALNNIFESTHKSNLLTSEIQQWIRSREEDTNLDSHELILLLQGVSHKKVARFKEDPIMGRYRRIRYEDLARAIQKIYKNKKVKCV